MTSLTGSLRKHEAFRRKNKNSGYSTVPVGRMEAEDP